MTKLIMTSVIITSFFASLTIGLNAIQNNKYCVYVSDEIALSIPIACKTAKEWQQFYK